ncbi:prenyltransferase/squalene oxidase repeat-containing protein [Brevibacterium atlanticum]|uniref:prenyltransferase/squalene oxidase repeat-containing protein n=1 Tax=Brevibacterium atlanticum TaxID=2697563 RepID=UPI00141E8EFF|nr:prenyltransferase/squalene oxidase repeat-containing protein [Brevibacterium atlanticum]
MIDTQLSDWLLESDPALRWQVERDLLGADEATWQATRARVVHEGFGAELLSHQDSDGQWAGGAFFPADFAFDDDGSQPWTATTWALKDLREWGAAASALEGTAEKLQSARWEYEDLPYWGGEVDVCINSWTLSNGLWLGADVDGLVDWFLDHQLPDGGWNCEWVEGSEVASFHSTLNALVALLDYVKVTGDRARVQRARAGGEEYLLSRDLFRRRGTGEPFDDRALALFHPRRWFYGILPALDHFREARMIDGLATDPRMEEAVEAIRTRRSADGAWSQDHRLDGDVWFHVDVPPGEPSRWVTLQAQRVLDWWDGTQPV